MLGQRAHSLYLWKLRSLNVWINDNRPWHYDNHEGTTGNGTANNPVRFPNLSRLRLEMWLSGRALGQYTYARLWFHPLQCKKLKHLHKDKNGNVTSCKGTVSDFSGKNEQEEVTICDSVSLSSESTTAFFLLKIMNLFLWGLIGYLERRYWISSGCWNSSSE